MELLDAVEGEFIEMKALGVDQEVEYVAADVGVGEVELLDVLAVFGVDDVGQPFFTHILSFEQVETLELGETFRDR